VGIQDRWYSGAMNQQENIIYREGNQNSELGTSFFVHKRISAVIASAM
jgi:hypothetical protein